MNEKKSQALENAIEAVRKFRFCGPGDDPDEQTNVTTGFRYLIIQLKRLAGPILPAEAAAQLAAIDVEVDNVYSAYDANAEITPLLFDIEEALEAARSGNIVTTAGVPSDLPFSRRNNFAPTAPVEITMREDAPEYLRMIAIDKPLELGFRPGWLREIVCRVLRERPDPDNWSEFPNIWGEVEGLTYGCPWFKVYDIIEAIYKAMAGDQPEKAKLYADELNDAFIHKGVGWQMLAGQIATRGNDAFERTVQTSEAELMAGGRVTAAGRIGKAVQALSARPLPDTSGAISHATSAMECVFHDITGSNLTLGGYLKQHSDLYPATMQKAIEVLWGFASNEGARHGREGLEPEREDAEFIVAIAAAMTAYLNRKHPRQIAAVAIDPPYSAIEDDDIPF